MLRRCFAPHFVLTSVLAVILTYGTAAKAQILSQLSLQQESFLSPEFEGADQRNFQYLTFAFKSKQDTEDLFKVDMFGRYSFDNPILNSTEISELYYQNDKTMQDAKLYFGRKKMVWNELDNRWAFSLWQPTYQLNPLLPEEQGLTGVFWDYSRNIYHASIFFSPLFLPNQGPSFQIDDNGNFEQSNPWFHTPPSSIQIFQETSQLQYNFIKPSDTSVVFQSSFAAKVGIGDEKGFQAQLSWAYKPMSELALLYNGVLDLQTDTGMVDLSPTVYYHTITGADFKYVGDRFTTGISMDWDTPKNEVPADPQWTYPVFSNAFLWSPFVDVDLKYCAVTVERLMVNGGQVTEVGDLASNTRPTINLQYPYREANQISIRSRLQISGQQWIRSQLSFTQSDLNQFSMIHLNSTYHISRLWNVNLDMLLVKANDETVLNQNEIVQYANNDRVLLGVGYVF